VLFHIRRKVLSHRYGILFRIAAPARFDQLVEIVVVDCLLLLAADAVEKINERACKPLIDKLYRSMLRRLTIEEVMTPDAVRTTPVRRNATA